MEFLVPGNRRNKRARTTRESGESWSRKKVWWSRIGRMYTTLMTRKPITHSFYNRCHWSSICLHVPSHHHHHHRRHGFDVHTPPHELHLLDWCYSRWGYERFLYVIQVIRIIYFVLFTWVSMLVHASLRDIDLLNERRFGEIDEFDKSGTKESSLEQGMSIRPAESVLLPVLQLLISPYSQVRSQLSILVFTSTISCWKKVPASDCLSHQFWYRKTKRTNIKAKKKI